jgi:hypothetical protein
MRLPQCFGCGERDVLLSHVVACHFHTCASKSEECRTFLREDQLSQHIKGVHISKKDNKIPIPKELLSAWKRNNPFLAQTALICGFCGMVFDTWVERLDHVFKHMDRNICKTSWWPERLPTLLSHLTRYVADPSAFTGYSELILVQYRSFHLPRVPQRVL